MPSPSPHSRIKKFSRPHTWVVQDTVYEEYSEIQATPPAKEFAQMPRSIQQSKAASQTAYLQSQINARKAAGQIQQRVVSSNKLTATTAQLQAQIDYQRRRAKAGQ